MGIFATTKSLRKVALFRDTNPYLRMSPTGIGDRPTIIEVGVNQCNGKKNTELLMTRYFIGIIQRSA